MGNIFSDSKKSTIKPSDDSDIEDLGDINDIHTEENDEFRKNLEEKGKKLMETSIGGVVDVSLDEIAETDSDMVALEKILKTVGNNDTEDFDLEGGAVEDSDSPFIDTLTYNRIMMSGGFDDDSEDDEVNVEEIGSDDEEEEDDDEVEDEDEGEDKVEDDEYSETSTSFVDNDFKNKKKDNTSETSPIEEIEDYNFSETSADEDNVEKDEEKDEEKEKEEDIDGGDTSDIMINDTGNFMDELRLPDSDKEEFNLLTIDELPDTPDN